MADKENPIARVTLNGQSWGAIDRGIYCFEAMVDGELSELQVAEEIAFDYLGAWTLNHEKCLDILRLHRAELAKSLERILHAVGNTNHNGHYLLTLDDMLRKNPRARDAARAKRSDVLPGSAADAN